jgi:hypothetical protein
MRLSLLCSVLLIALGCSRPVPQLDGVDLKIWKDDPRACQNQRGSFVGALQDQKDKLKGLDEKDLTSLLGQPDRKDLSEHHGKTYQYFLSPGPGCAGVDSIGLSLIVRFNATGVSREVAIE